MRGEQGGDDGGFHRAVLGAEDIEDDVFAAADVDGLGVVEDGVPGAVGGLEFARGSVGAGAFYVDVLYVGAEVGEAPGDVVVVSDDDEGRAGESDSCYVEVGAGWSGGFEGGLVPDAGDAEWLRCMSLERSGFPEAVWAPETAQLLEPALQAWHRDRGLRFCCESYQSGGSSDPRSQNRPVRLRSDVGTRICGGFGACEFGLGFVEGDVGDVFLRGGQVDEGLGGWMVAPGAYGIEVGEERGREAGGESFAAEFLREAAEVRSWYMKREMRTESRGVQGAGSSWRRRNSSGRWGRWTAMEALTPRA